MALLNFRPRVFFIVVFAGIFISGCKNKTTILASPPGYNFSQVDIDKLDIKLLEISGLAWDSEFNMFYAVNDESGILYTLDKESKAINGAFPFGGKGDYEDVALFKGIPYVLRSDGLIIKVMKDSTGKTVGVEEGKIPLPGINDFETLYSDPTRNALIMICKNCSTDNSTSVSAYAFYPDSIGFGNTPIKPLYVINAKMVEELSPFKTSKLQPSAAAINSKLQKLFILSSASHQLAVADLNGNVESVHKLTPKLFLQPEGIAFKQGGDLYISNEGVGAKATLLKFYFNKADDSLRARKAKIGYDFEVPDDKMELGKHLKEISGLAYVKGKDVILTENDEKGDIFTIDFANKKDMVDKVKFGGKDDYEDIVHTDTAIYMLVSSGSIVQVNTKDNSFSTKVFSLGLSKSEFEAMYLDADGESLILLCKDCAKEKDEIRAAYRFSLRTNTFSKDPLYIISINEIKKILGDDKAEFKPSAAGINPMDGKLYVVASVGKLLVVASKIGEVEEVFRLDPVLYNQPEGLTFAPNGDMYISNEGGEGTATILKFIYKK